jgi:hypothetical protein
MPGSSVDPDPDSMGSKMRAKLPTNIEKSELSSFFEVLDVFF